MKLGLGLLGFALVLFCIFFIPLRMMITKAYADSMYSPEDYVEYKVIPYDSLDITEELGHHPLAAVVWDKLLTYFKYELLWAKGELFLFEIICLVVYLVAIVIIIVLLIVGVIELLEIIAGPSIYRDSQNTHDTDINRTITVSIRSLLRDPRPDLTMEQLLIQIIESELSTETKNLIIDYCQDGSIRQTCGLNYVTLLAFVWQRINNSEHRSELLKVLEEQIGGSRNKCFTGKFNDLLSVLAGFYDDIVIHISTKAQIGDMILAIKKRIDPYDAKAHYMEAEKELLKVGYTRKEIKPWLDAIKES